jgi:protein SCO1
MRFRKATAISVSTLLLLGATLVVLGWEPDPDDVLPNEVHFPISCRASSQREFDHAVSLLHALRYPQAEASFTQITTEEPGCAMAYWGIAISRLKRPVAIAPSPEDVRAAEQAVRKAQTASIASEREKRYVNALAELVARGTIDDWHAHALAYERAMEGLAKAYPQDREASIFYALALNMAAGPTDKTYAKQTRASELLLIALAEQPNHPGLLHYLTYCVKDDSATSRDVAASQGIAMSRQTRRILLIALAPLLVAGMGWLAFWGPVAAEGTGAAIGGPFRLKSQTEQSVTDQDFRGKWLLVYFGYTHCSDVGPTTLTEIVQMLDALGPLASDVQPIFITVDPERDTPEVMREYVGAFDSRILGLTGTPADIAQVASAYRVYYKKQAGDRADYLMEHTAFVYVMDPAGHYATLFSPRGGQGPELMAARMRELMGAKPKG